MKPETEALLDLMITRALHGLDEAEQDLLDQALLTVDPDQAEQLERELEAALAVAGNAGALDVATLDPGVPAGAPAPERLIATLEADADRFFGTAGVRAGGEAGDKRFSGNHPSNVTRLDQGRSRNPRRSPPGLFGWTGWAVAALLLVTVWVGRPGPAPDAALPAGVTDARTALLDVDGTVQTAWGGSAWEEFSAVQGDVVWNDDRQEGYLRLANMPPNDPGKAQYQLWIVDPSRDEEPVDGGVFDVPPGAREVVVPIRAKLAVRSPVAFAITREQPGGVVVSEGPLLVVASRG